MLLLWLPEEKAQMVRTNNPVTAELLPVSLSLSLFLTASLPLPTVNQLYSQKHSPFGRAVHENGIAAARFCLSWISASPQYLLFFWSYP